MRRGPEREVGVGGGVGGGGEARRQGERAAQKTKRKETEKNRNKRKHGCTKHETGEEGNGRSVVVAVHGPVRGSIVGSWPVPSPDA
jgi:hypothetical protein